MYHHSLQPGSIVSLGQDRASSDGAVITLPDTVAILKESDPNISSSLFSAVCGKTEVMPLMHWIMEGHLGEYNHLCISDFKTYQMVAHTVEVVDLIIVVVLILSNSTRHILVKFLSILTERW